MSEKNDRLIAEYNAKQEQLVEIGKLSSDYVKGALRSAMVMNGGAAIALLAFTGNILSKTGGQKVADHLATGFTSFSYGVLIAATAVIISAITMHINFQFSQKSIEGGFNLRTKKYTYLKYITIKPWSIIFFLELIVFVLIVLSFVQFYFGVSETATAFTVDLSSDCINES